MSRAHPGPCARCHVKLSAGTQSYCARCHAERALERQGRKPRRQGTRPAAGPNTCCCGNSGCNGLTCDSIRYRTA